MLLIVHTTVRWPWESIQDVLHEEATVSHTSSITPLDLEIWEA